MRYSVVVPVFNEGSNIGAFCKRFVEELPAGGELLVVYDFDEDDTLPALAALPAAHRPDGLVLVRNTLGRGVRNAIVAGMRAASAPVILVMMGDLSDDFSRVEEMVQRAEDGADVVCASRYMRGGRQIGGPWLKGMLSRIAGLSLHAVDALPVHDPTNSFKAYRRDFLERTPIETTEGFALAMELTVKAHLAGGRVEEVPAVWHDRTGGESKFQLRKWLAIYLKWYGRALRQWSVFWSALVPLSILFVAGTSVRLRVYPEMATEYWLGIALHEAFAQGSRFGHDVVFTFGPWGFLLAGFHPDTMLPLFALRVAIAVVATIGVLQIVERLSGRRWLAVSCAMLFGVVAHICWADVLFLFLSVPVLLLFSGFTKGSSRWVHGSLIVVASLLGLTKFSFFVMGTVAVAAVSIDEVRRKRVPWTGFVFAGSVAAWWLLARQRLADLPSFFRDSLALASGYGEAMGMSDVLYSPRSLGPFTASAVLFTIFMFVMETRSPRSLPRALFFVGGWGALLLLLFKSAFVRADHFHIAPAAGVLLLAQVMYAARALRIGRVWAAFLLLPLLLAAHVVSLFGSGSWFRDGAEAARAATTQLASLARWQETRTNLEEIHAEAIAATAAPPLPMRADIFPAPYGVIARTGFTHVSRPLYVSYAVYTPELARRNAEWLARNAPPHVLFRIEAIDRQLPSLQDGATWPILLERYRPDGRAGEHLVLRRNAPPSGALNSQWTLAARFGARVVLPEREPLFARIAIELTRRGKLLGTFYRTQPLRIRLSLVDGTQKEFRLIRRMAQSEFLLSPLVETTDDFEAVFLGTNDKRVHSFVIAGDADSYEEEYSVTFLADAD